MQTLTYGFLKPVTGDKGSVFFPGLESNFQQLNDHNHNGTNSIALTSAASVAVTQAISAASWVDGGGGTYHQLVTVSAGLSYDGYCIEFREAVTQRVLYLTRVRASATTFTVYINDNTLDLTAVYT